MFKHILIVIVLVHFTNTFSISEILLSRINLTIDDVTSHLNYGMIKTPVRYENVTSVTVYGEYISGIIFTRREDLEVYNPYNASICIYHESSSEPTSINITQLDDGIYLSSIKVNTTYDSNWTCTVIPKEMLYNLYSYKNYHGTIGFRVKSDVAVNTNIRQFFELYIQDTFYLSVQSIDTDCKDVCNYRISNTNFKLVDALDIYEQQRRKKREVDCIPTWSNDAKKHSVTPVASPINVCSLKYKYIKFKDIGCNWIL
ncbi:SWPV1-200 [Shearwaterpox virus]|uniref:SWPV1-200 n=1 Tax=Shearwaterpox virus TaxID=1974596 RepID=A0A1V0S823_CNPV|nr:SWPV1-200 [Shearwaterpox virus]